MNAPIYDPKDAAFHAPGRGVEHPNGVVPELARESEGAMKYESRILSMVHVRTGRPQFDGTATVVTIVDEGGGEFLEIESVDTGGKVRIGPDEWPTLSARIDEMMAQCKDRSAPGSEK